MPILLDTPHPYYPPSNDGVINYPMALCADFRVKSARKMAVLVVEYGNVENGKWVAGQAEPFRIVMQDSQQETAVGWDPSANNGAGGMVSGVIKAAVTDFTDMRAALLVLQADVSKDYYDALGERLNLWLIDTYTHLEGTPV